MTPRATYRLQLRAHGVDLDAARRLVPYLARLGVSHLYLSPILKAPAGSTHGYDVVDPRVVGPAVGGARALERLAETAHTHRMALLADVVPNHMATDPEGPCFGDVLARGPASAFAHWFDVDWEAGRGRIVLPVLGAPRRTCLARGEIRLERAYGEVHLRAGGLLLPLAPETRPASARVSRAGLERLLRRQHYDLCYWRHAGPRINFRRFFDVNELIALRSDDARVFAETHGALAALLEMGQLGGVRVDHVDGIADPERYLRQLRRIAPRPSLVLVEKILAPGEALPGRWPVDGTTGYEYLNAAEAVMLDADGCVRIEQDWARRTRTSRSFAETARAAKRRAMLELLRPKLDRAVRALRNVSAHLDARTARAALVAFASRLDVYRVYPQAGGLDTPERRRVRDALAGAASDGAPRRGLDALGRLLLSRTRSEERLAAARRVQQLCVSAAAKGVEDTAFYSHAPLLSRAEVGGEPGHPLGDAVANFHAAMAARVERPRGLLAASTHDTKRSADVRARLDVLSERPDAWLSALDRWQRQNAALRRRVGGPDRSTELLFYQTLVGVWPLEGPDADGRRELVQRLDAYMLKAVREAKRKTSWVRPDERFEQSLARFVRGALLPKRRRSDFLDDVDTFVAGIARPGLWNALARRLLQLTAPGIPDLYQGDELWCFDLVDPDNRRPVDFRARARRLSELERLDAADASQRLRRLRAWVAHPEDGRLAMHVVRSALAARRTDPELFLSGAYRPVRVEGESAAEVLAFTRRRAGRTALVIVPRLTTRRIREPGAAPVGRPTWGTTRLVLPRALAQRRVTCALTRRRRTFDRALPVGEALDVLPLGLWVARGRTG